MIPIPNLPWRLIVISFVSIMAVWQIRAYADRVADEREVEIRAEYKAAEERATAEHEARIAEVETTYDAKLTTLQGRLDAAIARPATRVIRVPVESVCPAPVTENAGVPQPDSGDGLLVIDDPGWAVFRDWLYRYAGAAPFRG